MEKWLVWTLLELSTVCIIASMVLLWRSWKMSRVEKSTDNDDTAPRPDSTKELEDNANPASANLDKTLLNIIDSQINDALDKLEALRVNDSNHNPKRSKFKLWGTLLKVQKGVLLNDKLNEPLPIIKRFLSTILQAFNKDNVSEDKIKTLTENIEETEKELALYTERLIKKETIMTRQKELNAEIKTNLTNEKSIVKNISLREIELAKLTAQLNAAQKEIDLLQAKLFEKANDQDSDLYSFAENLTTKTKASPQEMQSDNYRSLDQLSALSKRQKNVIDQLKSEIDKSQKSDNKKQSKESQGIALDRLIRLTQESDSVILQLETEIDSANINIDNLKSDVYARDKKLKELEAIAKKSNISTVDSLKTNNENQKQTFSSFKQTLNDAQNTPIDQNALDQQSAEMEKLERLLMESETCVQLLAQELTTAEEFNITLSKKVTSLEGIKPVDNAKENKELTKSLERVREKNRSLANESARLKSELINVLTNTSGKAVKTEYNNKSVELDHLQLAFSELESKYLKSLSKPK